MMESSGGVSRMNRKNYERDPLSNLEGSQSKQVPFNVHVCEILSSIQAVVLIRWNLVIKPVTQDVGRPPISPAVGYVYCRVF